MNTTYTLYRPGQPPVVGSADLKPEPGYDVLRKLIEPLLDDQHLEHVSVLYKGRAADMFVDDEGAIKRLPMNEEATAIYRAATLQRAPHTRPESLSAIYGPAVVFDRRVWL